MKKIIILLVASVIIILIGLIWYAINISFNQVRPATAEINKNIVKDLSKIVRIPEGIAPPMQDFNQTIYSWEMETPAGEVTGITFKYTPSFARKDDKIIATLEMPENGDPSIFNKVLEAIIVDEQSLAAARDPQKANLGANGKSGYNSIKLAVSPKSGQTTNITWEFEKKTLSKELNSSYDQINKIPSFALNFLYGLPGFIIGLLKG
ncbi:MAG: hypothetical protein Q7S45_03535 [Candidatus Curtissbacteria bacterium]|nr:hypothetical protein [Candidatus Curtissbacteria bacterium]